MLQAVKVTPRDPGAAALTFVLTGYPGVMVHAGVLHDFPFPVCGCDACDETAETAADRLEMLVLTVAAGGYSERYPVGRKRWSEYALTAFDGSGSESGQGEPAPAAPPAHDAEVSCGRCRRVETLAAAPELSWGIALANRRAGRPASGRPPVHQRTGLQAAARGPPAPPARVQCNELVTLGECAQSLFITSHAAGRPQGARRPGGCRLPRHVDAPGNRERCQRRPLRGTHHCGVVGCFLPAARPLERHSGCPRLFCALRLRPGPAVHQTGRGQELGPVLRQALLPPVPAGLGVPGGGRCVDCHDSPVGVAAAELRGRTCT